MNKRKIFRKLSTLEETFNKIIESYSLQPVRTIKVSIYELLNRISAENVYAKIDVPSFNRAMMDGYAVRNMDTIGADEENPIILTQIGEVSTGKIPSVELEPNTTIEISTGSALPKGANAVVMVEYTKKTNNEIKIFRVVSPGENIIYSASDISNGQLIIKKGQRFSPSEIGTLAASNVAECLVFDRPKVAIISTGDEIIQPGSIIKDAQVYDINSYTIGASVIESGGDPIYFGIVGDSEKEMKKILKKAFSKSDLVITSGSTSAGIGDKLYKIINTLGKPGVIIHGVAVKPGKPLIVGVINSKLFLGLPGYPTSALSIFNVFASPIIRELSGVPLSEYTTLFAYTTSVIKSVKGRREFLPVSVIEKKGKNYIIPSSSGSSAITTLANSDGFITIPENTSLIPPNTEVKVHLYGQEVKPINILIIGSHSLAQDLLLEEIIKKESQVKTRSIVIGSTGGISSIKDGIGDIASIHVLDEKTGEYNIPILKKYNLENEVVLVKFLIRTQGLITPTKNPKNITGLKDLLRKDIVFVNRNPGSGTRILLDYKLSKLGVTPDKAKTVINGYWVELRTHQAVASNVTFGRADVGLASETVAKQLDLNFIPIAKEEFDLVIRKSELSNPYISEILKLMQSQDFNSIISKKYPWLKLNKNVGEIINI
ncbi:MAG: molybdopterin biosynthesis protein [Candidatus Ranarchaeia archaeon]